MARIVEDPVARAAIRDSVYRDLRRRRGEISPEDLLQQGSMAGLDAPVADGALGVVVEDRIPESADQLAVPVPSAAPAVPSGDPEVSDSELVEDARRRANTGMMIANIGGGYQRFLQNAFGVSPDPAQVAAYRRQAQAPLEQAREDIAARRAEKQEAQQEAQRKALREYFRTKGLDIGEGVSSTTLMELGQRMDVDDRFAEGQDLQRELAGMSAAERRAAADEAFERAKKLAEFRAGLKNKRGGKAGGATPRQTAELPHAEWLSTLSPGDRERYEGFLANARAQKAVNAEFQARLAMTDDPTARQLLGRGTAAVGTQPYRKFVDDMQSISDIENVLQATKDSFAKYKEGETIPGTGFMDPTKLTGVTGDIARATMGTNESRRNQQLYAVLENMQRKEWFGVTLTPTEREQIGRIFGTGFLSTTDDARRAVKLLEDIMNRAKATTKLKAGSEIVSEYDRQRSAMGMEASPGGAGAPLISPESDPARTPAAAAPAGEKVWIVRNSDGSRRPVSRASAQTIMKQLPGQFTLEE